MKFNTVKGMRDFPPEQARKKQFIEDTCRAVFEQYGFEYIETPVLEELSLLTEKGASGGDVRKELYSFTDKGGRSIGLRFDLTVPLARFVAGNPQIPKPFKRYQIGNAYRYDRPQKGRYRTFTQADVDIVGAQNVAAECEIACMVQDVMGQLKIPFTLVVNNRNLLETVALQNGVKKNQMRECFRILDKLDKIGEQKVREELKKEGISAQILGQLSADLDALPECNGKKELREVLSLLAGLGRNKNVRFSLSLARGLDYYTGTVFEVIPTAGPSVAAGGRYDTLIARFGGPQTPAVGISFGVDRLLDLLPENTIVAKRVPVFIVPIGNALQQAMRLAQELRAAGIATAVDLSGRSVSRGLEYAQKKGFLWVVLLGEDEVNAGTVTLRTMESGTQETLQREQLARALRARG